MDNYWKFGHKVLDLTLFLYTSAYLPFLLLMPEANSDESALSC